MTKLKIQLAKCKTSRMAMMLYRMCPMDTETEKLAIARIYELTQKELTQRKKIEEAEEAYRASWSYRTSAVTPTSPAPQ